MTSFQKWCSMSCLALILGVPTSNIPAMAEGAAIKVSILGAEPTSKDAQQVLDTFEKLMQAIAQREIDTIGTYMSPDVVVVDDRDHRLLFGKREVMEHIQKQVLSKTPSGTLKNFTVYNPFVDVSGDTAMVSFKATKEYGGPKPIKMVSWCSEVFERDRDRQWKVLHFRSNWSPLRAGK